MLEIIEQDLAKIKSEQSYLDNVFFTEKHPSKHITQFDGNILFGYYPVDRIAYRFEDISFAGKKNLALEFNFNYLMIISEGYCIDTIIRNIQVLSQFTIRDVEIDSKEIYERITGDSYANGCRFIEFKISHTEPFLNNCVQDPCKEC